MACEVHKDRKGTLWRVPPFSPKDTVKFEPIPHIDVWWDRDMKHKDNEMLVIRQETTADRADVVILTLGQLYDLIDAVNKAVEGI